MTGTVRKVQAEQLDIGSTFSTLVYQGTWNANTNTPALPAAAPANNGWYYLVSVAGTHLAVTYSVGDWVVSNGTAWDKVDNPDAVVSVNGNTGVVVLTAGDVGAAPSAHVGSGGGAHSDATPSVSGFMSATDKTKLDAITGTNTGDQTITLTGDVTGSGTGSFATTLSNSGVAAGTYESVTVDAKGRVTGGTNPAVPYAPSDATYVVLSSNSGLSGERTLALTANQLSGSDGGSGNPYTVSIADNPILPGTGSVTKPIGTTAQRPGSPVAGMERQNSTEERAEFYSNNAWLEHIGTAFRNTTLTNIVLGTTGTGTNILSVTIPGGMLNTSGILRIRIVGTLVNGSGGNRTATPFIRYGATTLYSDTSPNVAGGDTVGVCFDLYLVANNATNAQTVCGRISIGSTGAVATGTTGDLNTDEIVSNAIIAGSSAIDSTTNQTLAISILTNGTTFSMNRYFYLVEKL